jgi:hypothetical protein
MQLYLLALPVNATNQQAFLFVGEIDAQDALLDGCTGQPDQTAPGGRSFLRFHRCNSLLTCWTGIERGRFIKALRPPRDFVPPPQDPAHDPLPVGHARCWGVINARIVLEGAPYPLSIFPR